jgi:hypothetical protein
MSSCFRPHLPTKVDSGIAACPIALDPTSQLGRVPVLPRISQFLVGREPQIYKGLAGLAKWLSTRVPKAQLHVSEVPDI